MKKFILFPTFLLFGCSSIHIVGSKPVEEGCLEIQSIRATGKTEKDLKMNLKKETSIAGGTHLYYDPEQILEMGFAHGYNKDTGYYLTGYGVAYKCTAY